MNNELLIRLLKGIDDDLSKAYTSYYAPDKDTHIKVARGKLNMLLEIAKDEIKE
jgi:hypothetical protein